MKMNAKYGHDDDSLPLTKENGSEKPMTTQNELYESGFNGEKMMNIHVHAQLQVVCGFSREMDQVGNRDRKRQLYISPLKLVNVHFSIVRQGPHTVDQAGLTYLNPPNLCLMLKSFLHLTKAHLDRCEKWKLIAPAQTTVFAKVLDAIVGGCAVKNGHRHDQSNICCCRQLERQVCGRRWHLMPSTSADVTWADELEKGSRKNKDTITA
uniref:Piwi domain-containing protein n=1 Tax=Panagrellus redivivus TaxID=6233 RepID=A0A7E4VWB2_PANRE